MPATLSARHFVFRLIASGLVTTGLFTVTSGGSVAAAAVVQDQEPPTQTNSAQDNEQPPAETRQVTISLQPLTLDQPLEINASTRDIAWQGETIHLVSIPKLTFALAEDQHLTATAKATLLTFDEAPYLAHVAVFDEQGRLLGTATAGCGTQRVWLGKYLMSRRELEFDFGRSDAFQKAAYFTLAFSDHPIQTPDDWQK